MRASTVGKVVRGAEVERGRGSFADILKDGKRNEMTSRSEREESIGGRKNMVFQSTEDETGWLQGALTGKLKEDFLWKFHGEDIQNKCIGKLKLSDMGDRMILILSETSMKAKEEIGGFKEWAEFWMDWWCPWRSRDVNQRRLIWTRWRGVPLQAWTRRFFNWGCSMVGRVVEVHELTESRRKIDVAYVRILIGLNSVEETFMCKIDGQSFNVRIEEICCAENELSLKRGWESDSDSNDELLEELESVIFDTFAASRGSSLARLEVGKSVHGGTTPRMSHRMLLGRRNWAL